MAVIIPTYTAIPSVDDLIESIQPESIISRTFYRDGQFKGVVFGFDAGQALSEHTSPKAAVIQIVRGEATVTLGTDTHEPITGAWVHMPPRLQHSIYAKTPLVMLLMMMDTRTTQ